MKNILFIAWDGPQTSYMEGLFLPIFHEMMKRGDIRFHVMQFTWADEQKTNAVRDIAESFNIPYTPMPVQRKPIASLGAFWTIYKAPKIIEKYIKENDIDILLPRSTFPAMMANRINRDKVKILFDADGLPIEERLEFGSLKKNSLQYRLMKSAETRMLEKADAVLCRSQKAADIHIQTLKGKQKEKFFVVRNGRDAHQFRFDPAQRKKIREALGIREERLFIYAGSLGPQYCMDEMLGIFEAHLKKEEAKFLILTGDLAFAKTQIPEQLKQKIIIERVKAEEVPAYLSAADIAFALRQPSYSMQGVAPIKLGEYLLCGLPTLASRGIGDTEEILKDLPGCFLYDHSKTLEVQLPEINSFLEKAESFDQEEIRRAALGYFSLEAAAESYLRAFEFLESE